MPELPEVETMRRCVLPAAGCRICGVRRPRTRLRSITLDPPLPALRRRLCGRTIGDIGRLGKRIVFALDSAERLVIEPRMSGLVLLSDPPDERHLRLVLDLEHARARGQPPKPLLFWDQRGLGVVRLTAPEEFARLYGPQRIGPDALGISAEELRQRLAGSRRAIKVALLDQRAVAGIGNLYASEILHRAGLHPACSCRRLRAVHWQRLHLAVQEVLCEAIEHQGSTLRDGTYRIARGEEGRFQYRHRVYQRHGQPCLTCGRGQIVRIVQAQRSTFFCPRCQRRP